MLKSGKCYCIFTVTTRKFYPFFFSFYRGQLGNVKKEEIVRYKKGERRSEKQKKWRPVWSLEGWCNILALGTEVLPELEVVISKCV